MSPSRVILAYRHRSREETYGRFRAAAEAKDRPVRSMKSVGSSSTPG
jgi:hypothetical protein